MSRIVELVRVIRGSHELFLSRIFELSNICHIRVIRGFKRHKDIKNFVVICGCHDFYHEPLARNRMGAIFEFSNICYIRVIRGFKRHKDIKKSWSFAIVTILSRIIELSNICHIRVIRGFKRHKDIKNFVVICGCHDFYHEPLARNRMGAIFEFSNICYIRVIRGFKRHKDIKKSWSFAIVTILSRIIELSNIYSRNSWF